jgi:hypothetical protein
MKDSFHMELESAFYQFPKYHTKILLGDFNAKVGREDIFKLTIWNESLHEISNHNGARVVKFVTSKYLIFNSIMFCGLVVRVPGYRSRGPGSIPGATRFSDK